MPSAPLQVSGSHPIPVRCRDRRVYIRATCDPLQRHRADLLESVSGQASGFPGNSRVRRRTSTRATDKRLQSPLTVEDIC
ncbi:hypothetical protein ANANG_G00264420 [Anguilla anguilla]|uniref:Uncharacterized protein n=1 Tax=Anguilla anguilla TaxID=7936 RepID=A0A9D3RLL9_ANGAN|nr:hypothetical protein ANANG_G00264420 [Anguilla anguilla]